jgi:hypothetical protein
MTDQRQDYAGVPIDALALQAHCNTRLVPILAEYAPEDITLNAWLMRESTGRDYPLSDCGPRGPINDQNERPGLSREAWQGVAWGLAFMAAVGLVVWLAIWWPR